VSTLISPEIVAKLGEDDDDDLEIMAGVLPNSGPDLNMNPVQVITPLFTAPSPEDTTIVHPTTSNLNSQNDVVDLTDDNFADDFLDITSDFGIHSSMTPVASTSALSFGNHNAPNGPLPSRSGFQLASPKRKAWRR